MSAYDAVIAGAGLTGASCARALADRGKKCLVVERESGPGGLCADSICAAGYPVCMYGAHIFHTSDPDIWQFVQRFGRWRHYRHKVVACYKGLHYSFPINLITLVQIWGHQMQDPEAARRRIADDTVNTGRPGGFKNAALTTVGRTLYEMFFEGYTIKQWEMDPDDIPAYVFRRIPVRFNYDDSYYDSVWQAIPEEGYTALVSRMLDGIEVRYNTDFNTDRDVLTRLADTVVYTGSIDEYYGYALGPLNYRTLDFEVSGSDPLAAAINYTAIDVEYTRVVHYGWFYGRNDGSVSMAERSRACMPGDIPMYPEFDVDLYQDYRQRADRVIFAGRLGEYRYMNMDQAIKRGLDIAEIIAR